jgi:outer membrane protein insertion porin family
VVVAPGAAPPAAGVRFAPGPGVAAGPAPVAPRVVAPPPPPVFQPRPRAEEPPAPPPPPPAPPPVAPDLRLPEEEPPPRIVRIEFKGTSQYAPDSLKVMMKLKEGGPLDKVLLDEDTAMLYRYFKEVRIDQIDVPEGVVLVFTVSENPLVREVVVQGLEEMSVDEVKAMLRTKAGYPFFDRDVDLDRQDVADAYRRKGFHFADVPEPIVETLQNGGLKVTFTVVEGPKVKVERVEFQGNRSIGRQRLVEAMETRESSLLSTRIFSEDVLREDLVALRRLYRNEGFPDAEVVLDDLRPSDDKSRVVISIVIDEGPRYVVGSVVVELEREPPGPGAMPPQDVARFSEQALAAMLGVASGRPYSGEVEEKGRERVKEALFAASYIDADVDPAVLRPRADGRTLDLVVRVRPGLKYRVARIDVVGNEYTRDKIVRREIYQRPGEYVDRNELDRALARVRALGYFERVTRRIEDVENAPGCVPSPDVKTVTYEVVEAKTGKLTFGVAVSTEGGLGANVSFQKRNFDIARPPRSFDDLLSGRAFTGAGQTLDILFAPGTVTNTFSIQFGEPRLFGSEFALGLGFSTRINFRESYREEFTGYNVQLGHPVYHHPEDRLIVDAAVRWRHELIGLHDVGANAVPGVFLFEGESELRSLAFILRLRAVDDAARPRARHETSFTAEYNGGVLGGDLDFWRLMGSHESRWLVHEDARGKRHFVRFAARADAAEAFDDTPEVPPFSRFYLGGQSTLRGFAFREAGPHANGRPTGGEFRLAGTLEYEFPIVEDLLSVVAFTDQGTLSTSLDMEDSYWRVSVGAGVRIKIPFLSQTPLGIDIAWPILKDDEDETQLVSFAFSRDF